MDFTSVAVGNEPDWTQDAFLTNWEEWVRREPQGVTFSIAAPKSEFFFGEVIPFQLKFTATEPRAFLADSRLQGRVGRMNYVEEFFVDQAALAADPLQGLPSGEGRMGGGPVILSEKPFGFERVLNEQIRFRRDAFGRSRNLDTQITICTCTRGARPSSWLRMFLP